MTDGTPEESSVSEAASPESASPDERDPPDDGSRIPSTKPAAGRERAEPDASLPTPPRSFVDKAGRDVEVRTDDGSEETFEALVGMYDDYHPLDRAQGLPPVGERRVRSWLRDLVDNGLNLVAWHGDLAVGHATLIPDHRDDHELVVFVAHDYQLAGIGSRLLRTLLGYGDERGVDRIWLTVQRGNLVARHLYESLGFEVLEAQSGGSEFTMARDL